MTTSKELAIKMIKELDKASTDLINKIEKAESEIEKNDELIKLIVETAGLTDNDLFGGEDEYINWKEIEVSPTPEAVRAYGHYHHKYDDDYCCCHCCDDCIYTDLDPDLEPCTFCWQISDDDSKPCFFYPRHN